MDTCILFGNGSVQPIGHIDSIPLPISTLVSTNRIQNTTYDYTLDCSFQIWPTKSSRHHSVASVAMHWITILVTVVVIGQETEILV